MRLLDEKLVGRLSRGCEVVTCFVEEHVMTSAASSWSNGELVWRVVHESEQAHDHLEAQGHLPERFAAIHDQLRAQQRAEPDGACFMFDIPVELAKALTGFRHDEDCAGISMFDVLVDL